MTRRLRHIDGCRAPRRSCSAEGGCGDHRKQRSANCCECDPCGATTRRGCQVVDKAEHGDHDGHRREGEQDHIQSSGDVGQFGGGVARISLGEHIQCLERLDGKIVEIPPLGDGIDCSCDERVAAESSPPQSGSHRMGGGL